MLAILLRGIGWHSGVEREGDVDDGDWPGTERKGSAGDADKGKGDAAWGGAGGLGGLLVYGPSGCGKTHLTHALAKWCSTTTQLSPSEQPYTSITTIRIQLIKEIYLYYSMRITIRKW